MGPERFPRCWSHGGCQDSSQWHTGDRSSRRRCTWWWMLGLEALVTATRAPPAWWLKPPTAYWKMRTQAAAAQHWWKRISVALGGLRTFDRRNMREATAQVRYCSFYSPCGTVHHYQSHSCWLQGCVVCGFFNLWILPNSKFHRLLPVAAIMLLILRCSNPWAPTAGAKLRSGWGTPVFHLAHLNFFERLDPELKVLEISVALLLDKIPPPYRQLLWSKISKGDLRVGFILYHIKRLYIICSYAASNLTRTVPSRSLHLRPWATQERLGFTCRIFPGAPSSCLPATPMQRYSLCILS